MINEVLKFIKTNKAVTRMSEVMLEFPELSEKELNQPDVIKLLKNNKIEMQKILKVKLFKSNTTQSLLQLNKMLENEDDSNTINDYIDNLTDRWYTGE